MITTLYIKKPEDWFKISIQQVLLRNGTGLLRHYGTSLIRALKANYPEHKHVWASYNFAHPHQQIYQGGAVSKSQLHLRNVLCKLLPNEAHMNHRHPDLTYRPDTKMSIEFDVSSSLIERILLFRYISPT
jgi:hypothetical protein